MRSICLMASSTIASWLSANAEPANANVTTAKRRVVRRFLKFISGLSSQIKSIPARETFQFTEYNRVTAHWVQPASHLLNKNWINTSASGSVVVIEVQSIPAPSHSPRR